MGAHNSQTIQKDELIWIDQNVNNEENQEYQKEIKKLMKVNLSCFTEVSKAMEYLKKLEFVRTYIICSGRLYPSYIVEFKSNINDLMICPKMIIFCGDKVSYLKRNQDNDVLEINHPFYNSGGVHDHIREVKQFLGEKGPTIEPISYEMIYNPEDRLIFQTISNENDLILPLFFSEYIKKPVEEKVNEFNQYVFKRYCDRYELNEIFSQLVQTRNIPNEVLFKFWLRAYSSEGNFSKDINEELKTNNLDKYLPFIECMYEGSNDSNLDISSDACLYRYSTLTKNKLNELENNLSKKGDNLPALIMYSKSFLLFYTSQTEASKNNNNSNSKSNSNNINVLFIIQNAKENLISFTGYTTMDRYTFYPKDDILIFPFFCFEIAKIEKVDNNNYNIYLESLHKYKSLFKEDHKELVKKIPEDSLITKDIFSVDLISDECRSLNCIITIIYKIDKGDNKIKIFGENFVKNNKGKCFMIYEGQKLDISEYFESKDLKDKEKIEIKLTGLGEITDISYLFELCNSLKSLPNINKLCTEKITNMSSMFRGCSNLESLPDISNWNTKNVTDMSYLFSKCASLKTLPDISKWNTENVTNMSGIFDSCTNLKLLPDISKWKTSNVTDMSFMFYNSPYLESLPDLSVWDTSNVKDMSSLFEKCSFIASLPDISKWNTKNVNNMSYMFYFCISLKSLPEISKWNINNVQKSEYMFYGLKNSVKIPENFKK